MQYKAVRRISFSALALLSALASAVGLTHLEAEASLPLRRLEARAVDAVTRLAARPAPESEVGRRREALAKFIAARESREFWRKPSERLAGIYEPEGSDLWGRVLAAESRLGVRFQLVHLFVGMSPLAHGELPRHRLEQIWEAGSVALVTWEPWTESFDGQRIGGLGALAAGTYDAYLDAWALAARDYGRVVLVRLGHEMNDPYRYPWGPGLGTRPEDFVAAFRHVRERFTRVGADNVLWVYSPSIAHPGVETYYPGKDAVDWIATGVLNYGTAARWSRWSSFGELLGERYDTLARFGHPMLIAELGSTRDGGDAARWYADAALALAERCPDLDGLVLFHDPRDRTLGYRELDFSVATTDGVREAASEFLRTFVRTPNR